MTRHRTITGFVAVVLLAVAATAATIRSHKVDANKLPTAGFEDRWSAMSASAMDKAERSFDVR